MYIPKKIGRKSDIFPKFGNIFAGQKSSGPEYQIRRNTMT